MSAINYHLADNMEFMAKVPDNYYDLCIADPEQGKGEHGGTKRSEWVKQKNGEKLFVNGNKYEDFGWDNEPPPEEYFSEIFRISRYQIIWGSQYLKHNYGPGRIIWDKCNGKSDQYDCEIAYQNINDRTELFRYMWNGMLQGTSINRGHVSQGNYKLKEKRFHPTQKPSALYAWTLMRFNISKEWKIFDPNLGSGSIGVAFQRMGYNLDACEKIPQYLDNAKKWLELTKTPLF